VSEEGDKEITRIELAVSLARDRFLTSQFNCAEATLWALDRALDLGAGERVLRAATPFGAGIGRCQATCGALSGAIIALGLVLGRTHEDDLLKQIAYERAQALHAGFVAASGSDSCRVLNPQGFDRPDLRTDCVGFVQLATRLAAALLLSESTAILQVGSLGIHLEEE